MKKVTVVVGTQWGDEGKGKIVDLLSENHDVVVRYQGGANAGHTVHIGDKRYVLHLIPSGILHKDKTCVMGNGMVIDLLELDKEAKYLKEMGVNLEGRLFISKNAHLILPEHLEKDAEKGKKIGTTKRGIGPAYESKVARTGLRFGEILERENMLDESYLRTGIRFLKYSADISILLNNYIDEGKSILFEGAQGTFLDIDHGTYPYVTSSNTTAGGALTGTGVGPKCIDEIFGVVKAYTTRVGNGPFPVELGDDKTTKKEEKLSKIGLKQLLCKINSGKASEQEIGQYLRTVGGEYGATTGRPRRCGWLDLTMIKRARIVNGLTGLAITKLDVLDDLREILVCTGYRDKRNGNKTDVFPMERYNDYEPQYKALEGWKTSTSDRKKYKDLPIIAREYLEFIEQQVGIRIKIVSVGKERNQTIFRGD